MLDGESLKITVRCPLAQRDSKAGVAAYPLNCWSCHSSPHRHGASQAYICVNYYANGIHVAHIHHANLKYGTIGIAWQLLWRKEDRGRAE